MPLPKDPKKLEEYLKKLSISGKRKYEFGFINPMKGKSLSEETKKKIGRTGPEHNNWKGGHSEGWYRKLMAENKVPAICVDCGRTDKIHIHHKDKNHENNIIENLEFVCPKCHHKRHPTIYTDERRKEQSIRMMGNNNPFYGKKHSEETRKKMSMLKKNQTSCFKGKTHTLESRRKMSESKKGRIPWNKGVKKNAL